MSEAPGTATNGERDLLDDSSEQQASATDSNGVYLASDGNYYDLDGNMVSPPSDDATAETDGVSQQGFSGQQEHNPFEDVAPELGQGQDEQQQEPQYYAEYDEYGNPVYDTAGTADDGQYQQQFTGEEPMNDGDDIDGPQDTYERPQYDLNGDPIVYDDAPDAGDAEQGYYGGEQVQYDEYGNPVYAGEVEYDEDGNPIVYDDQDEYAAPPGTGYEDEDGVHDGYDEYNTSDDGQYDFSPDPYYDNYDYDVEDEDMIYDEDDENRGMGDENLPGVFVDGDADETQSLKGDDELKKKKKRRRLILLKRKKKKREQERKKLHEEEDKERRRRCCWLLLCLLCCLLLLLLIALGIYFGLKDDEESFDDDGEFIDDDFVQDKPYMGRMTTPMDPYVKDDCYFGDNIQPHVINQCECYQAIDVIANDTMELYHEIRVDINNEIYSGEFDDPITSCDPINQALYWLSSGNTRDAGDLYQRFVMALTFIKMNGTSWDLQNLWLSDDSECIWYGLQCNGNFQLNNFALDTNNVHGSMPTELAVMDSLRTISLSRNHISGYIPTEIITLPHLENLFLYTNNLIGSIPKEVGEATNLKTLRLENNLFFGFLTKEIGKATSLEELSVGFNEFWRRIPTEIGLLTNMRWLVMEDNRFSGTLPTEIGLLTKLEYFLLSKNLMTGTIPTELAAVSDLQEFRLADTGLGGVFPTALSQLSKLHRLEMGANNFKGTRIFYIAIAIFVCFGMTSQSHCFSVD